MVTFKKYNLIGGWLCFVIAAIVYLLSMEPTASLWDCAEFIATSYKLEVGHPPGAPLFMIIGRVFSAFVAPEKAAMMVNAMSSLASAATIMFLFWTITHLVRRSYKVAEDQLTKGQLWAVIGAGLVGATAYMFTDTFWFSAIEGEVYAMSSLFTAVVFWAILKWEEVADEPHANRWLVLIAYLTGLAIGVHLLNLLVIPAIVLIYYFKKYPEVRPWGVVKAVAVSLLIVVVIMWGVIPKTVQLGAFVDRIFVNSFGAGVNVGFTLFVLSIFAVTGWAVYYTHKKGKVLANTIVLCFGVLMLGFSSYASVVIRSSVNPPMNSNYPDNPYKLLSFLNREQYGERPVLNGPYYSSPLVDAKYKDKYYMSEEDSTYHKVSVFSSYVYADGFKFFFPRMYSPDKEADYKAWVDVKGKNMSFNGEMVNVPTFGENMTFFFGYQLNFMYWRYFLWNFVGRQSDMQSSGEITDGNWMSGIKPIDELFLGTQDNLPREMKQNKGRNPYYFLPFILGIIGLVFHSRRDGRNFSVVMTVFFMTGLAIAIYLNMSPNEPRERDYVFAGSFYAFAIWLGFGVTAIYELLKKYSKKDGAAVAMTATAVALIVPVILGAKNWDDHDRSGRYIARDLGYDYLNTTLPNSIIINYGDNDTFPLWYAQEVESVRTDVRIMNMSYLDGEWYIDQMKVRTNESAPVPFTLPQSKYTYTNESFRVIEEYKEANIKLAVNFVVSNDPRTKKALVDGSMIDYLPTKTLLLPVNKENAIKSGIVRAEDAHLMVDTIRINLGQKTSIRRSEMMFLDMLANFDWQRPLYFTSAAVLRDFGLHEYLQLDGFAYRLVPIRTPLGLVFGEAGRIDSRYLYDNLMNKYSYGGLSMPKTYVDQFSNTVVNNVQGRTIFARLANQLMSEGDTVRAVEVLDRSLEVYPLDKFKRTYMMNIQTIDSYFRAGETEKGRALFNDYAGCVKEYIVYFMQFQGGGMFDLVLDQLRQNVWVLSDLYTTAKKHNQSELVEDIGKFMRENKLYEGAE